MDPFRGGFGLQRGHFSVKMYVKMKELGPVGGGVRRARPPRSAYDYNKLKSSLSLGKEIIT